MTTAPEPKSAIQRLTALDPLVHAPARLAVLTYLYVVDQAEYLALSRITGLTWGNLASHLNRLQQAGYIEIEKEFRANKPCSLVQLTPAGRSAFRGYKKVLVAILERLPD